MQTICEEEYARAAALHAKYRTDQGYVLLTSGPDCILVGNGSRLGRRGKIEKIGLWSRDEIVNAHVVGDTTPNADRDALKAWVMKHVPDAIAMTKRPHLPIKFQNFYFGLYARALGYEFVGVGAQLASTLGEFHTIYGIRNTREFQIDDDLRAAFDTLATAGQIASSGLSQYQWISPMIRD